MLQLKVTPIVGLPQFTGWSQVAESTASASARLVCVFAISGKHAGNVGRDINERISDFYFYDVEQLHDFLKQLVSYVHDNDCKIYFSCAVLSKSKSVFATYGGSVFLKRNEKAGKILVSDFNIKIVEGTYQSEDVFVLTTLQADQFLSEIQQKFIQGYETDIIITSIVPGLHAQKDSSLSALVFISKEVDSLSAKSKKTIEDSVPFFQKESENLEPEALKKDKIENTENINSDLPIKPGLDSNLNKFSASVSISTDSSFIPVLLKKYFVFFKNLLIILFKFIKRLILFTISFFKKVNLTKITTFFKPIRFSGIQSLWKRETEYVTDREPEKNKIKFFITVIVLIFILTIVGFVSYQRNKDKKQLVTLLEPIESEFSLAKEKLEDDPIEAREMIVDILAQTETLEEENKTNSSIKLVTNKKNELSDYLIEISGKEEITELDIFYDLRLVKSDFIASGLDIENKKLLVYDKDMKQVILLDHDSKQVILRDFSSREFLNGGVLNEDYAYFLTDGIYKSTLDENAELEEVRELGDSNRAATLISAYDRFVYAVNPEKRNIYRYAQTDEGYSEPVGWIKSATGIQYEELRSIAVDGDVWLTTSDGQLKKFTSGREEVFSIRGLENNFSSDIYVYTNIDLENLYVLDPENSRVVIISKNGDFIKEFKSISLGAANNIAVSESLGKIFAISGSILYQINL